LRFRQTQIISAHCEGSLLQQAIGKDIKGKISPLCYVAAIPLSFWNRWAAMSLYVFVGILWLVPDRRIESLIEKESN